MEFQLLFNLDVVTHAGLILDQHFLVVLVGKVDVRATHDRFDVAAGGISPLLFTTRLGVLHLHVHEDLDAGLDILQNLERTHLLQLCALLDELVFVVVVDLDTVFARHTTLLTSSLDRIFTDRYRSINASSSVSSSGLPPAAFKICEVMPELDSARFKGYFFLSFSDNAGYARNSR